MRQRQLTPSTAGLQVNATHYHLLSPLPPHTVPASRHRSSSGRCIMAHLRPVHKTMGDEGFATGTDSLCGWSSVKECRSRVRARSLVLFLLSPFSWAVFAERLLQRFHLLTKNLNKYERVGSLLTTVEDFLIFIHISALERCIRL